MQTLHVVFKQGRLLAYKGLLLKAKALGCRYDQNLKYISLNTVIYENGAPWRYYCTTCVAVPVALSNVLSLSLTTGLEQLFSTGAPVLPFSCRGQSVMSGNSSGCHNSGEECYWHLVGRAQGCCEVSYNEQDSSLK